MKQIELPRKFIDKFPNMNHNKMMKYWNRYLQVNSKHLLFTRGFYESTINVSIDDIRRECSSFVYNDKRHYVWNEFYEVYPFFSIDQKGFTGYNTRIKMFDRKIQQLIDFNQRDEFIESFIETTRLDEYEIVPVNMKSLANYIKDCRARIKNQDYDRSYIETIERNLRQAQAVKMIAEWRFKGGHGKHELIQLPNKSPFGRTYYKGINLQNLSKEVRSAALGDHIQLDLSNAALAIKLMYVEDLVKDVKNEYNDPLWGLFTYTKEYIDKKVAIRKRLAKHIQHFYDGEALVKRAMAAIMFGATATSKSWIDSKGDMQASAISDIIMNQEDRTRFLTDPWVISFVNEQKQINEVIIDDYIKDPENLSALKAIPDMLNGRGQLRKQAAISYIFQHVETAIMDQIVEIVKEHNLSILGRIHDAILLDSVTPECLIDIRQFLRDNSRYLKIERNDVDGYTGRLLNSTQTYEQEVAEHRSFIIEQEKKVAALVGKEPHNPYAKPKFSYQPQEGDGFYAGHYDGGNHTQYDPDNDSSLEEMTEPERKHHYKIVGFDPTIDRFPPDIKKLLNR